MTRLFILLAVFVSPAMSAQAATTKYVIDEILITMRSGQGSQFQILRTLPSGTPLEILQSEEKSGYSLARTQKGTEGWVLTQYLSNQPIHRDRLETALKRLAKLEQENKELRQNASSKGKQASDLERELKSLTEDNEKMNKELIRIKNISKKPMKLAEENKVLKTDTVKMEKEVNMLRQENQSLKDRSTKEWILAGAGVLFFGIVFGLILPNFKSSRRTSWDSSL